VEAKRHPEVEERALQPDRPLRAAHVPAVAPAVSVRVVEVVGLPRVRREHDGDAVGAEHTRAEHHRRVARAPVGRTSAEEVEPARPLARAHEPKPGARAAVARPAHVKRGSDGAAVRLHVHVRHVHGAPEREHLQSERLRIGGDVEGRKLARGVASPQEPELDSLHAHHGRVDPLAAPRPVIPIHARAPGGVADGQPQDVCARCEQPRRSPGQCVRSRRERPRVAPDHRRRRPVLADRLRAHGVHSNASCTIEPERDERSVPEAVAVRADGGEESPVPGERRRAVRDAQIEQLRRRNARSARGADRERCQQQEDDRGAGSHGRGSCRNLRSPPRALNLSCRGLHFLYMPFNAATPKRSILREPCGDF